MAARTYSQNILLNSQYPSLRHSSPEQISKCFESFLDMHHDFRAHEQYRQQLWLPQLDADTQNSDKSS